MDAKTRILDAADAVFVRRGIDGARMQEIADEAGVNKSLLHYYFRSKAGLAKEVWLRIASTFVPGVLEVMASDLPLADKIDRFVNAYHTILTRYPYLLTYVLSEAARRPELISDFFSQEKRRAAHRMIVKLREQIDEQVSLKKLAPILADQFFVTLVGSSLYPFVAQPMLAQVLGLNSKELKRFMEQRRTDLPSFLKRTLSL